MVQHGVDRSGAAGGAGAPATPIDETIVDAKGDLLVGDAPDSIARLAVGSNDFMLVADSAQSLGVKWAGGDTAFQAIVTTATVETVPAVGDLVMISDVSLTPDSGRKMTLENLFTVINGLTADATPDPTADFLLTYDTSAGGVKKALPNNVIPAASDTVAGRIEIATDAEMESASDTTRAVTPGRQHRNPSAAKAWANFNGSGTPAFNASYNCSSITDNGVGQYTVNLTTAFSSANYAVVGGNKNADFIQQVGPAIASGVLCNSRTAAGGYADVNDNQFVAFGDQ